MSWIFVVGISLMIFVWSGLCYTSGKLHGMAEMLGTFRETMHYLEADLEEFPDEQA